MTLRPRSRPAAQTFKRALVAATIMPLLAYASPDDAPDSAAADAADEGGIASVVVTAQRREQNIQNVPIAITALGAEALEGQLDSGPSDIARLVPNLYSNPTGGRSSRPRWFLRGVGVNTSSLVSPIGVYFDEVHLSNLDLHSFPLFDLERVEVLRGPQGTLWGKNTTGGAIHFISKKPTFDSNGYVKLGVGNLDQKALEGAFGGTLIDDKLAGRISYLHDERGGWARNTLTGDKRAGEYDDNAVRGQLLFTPTENIEATLNVHFRSIDSYGVPGYSVGVRAGGANDFGYVSPAGPDPQIGDAVNRNNDLSQELKSNGQSLNLKFQLGDFTLTSLTAYEEVETGLFGDREQSPDEVIRTYDLREGHQVSQEIRLTSSPDKPLTWIAGLYYFNDSQDGDSTSATLPSVPQKFGVFYQNTRSTVDTESYAGFGSVSYQFTPRFSTTAGLRWTTETIGIELQGVDGGARGATVYSNVGEWWRRTSLATPLRVNAVQNEENTWDAWTYDFTPSFQLTDDINLFFRYARGFRSGGYNASVTTQAAVNTVQPERNDSYELGTKTAWLDGRLIANATAFYYEWNDMQLNIQGVTSTGLNASTLKNAALGKGHGLELELTAVPIDSLRIGLNGSYLHARYEDFKETLANGSIVDHSGLKFARAPEKTVGLDAEYTIPFTNGHELKFGTDWQYQSGIYYSSVDQVDPLQKQGGYTIGNAQISYAIDRVEISAFLRNLTDKSYDIITVVPANGAYRTTTGYPQTYGLSFRASF